MTPYRSSDWQHLAEQASKEHDPEKLMNLVNELNGILCEREETSRKQQHQGGANLFRAAAQVVPMFAESGSRVRG